MLLIVAEFPCSLPIVHLIAVSRYIAKTLYGDEEEQATPRSNSSVEEPKVLGINPGSNEKVALNFLSWITCFLLARV